MLNAIVCSIMENAYEPWKIIIAAMGTVIIAVINEQAMNAPLR